MDHYYGVVRSNYNTLSHYGVKGMKWGVRKYIDKNGNITKAALKRYGSKSTKKTSARKMQRDFNRLDQSAANKIADLHEQATYGARNAAYMIKDRVENGPLTKKQYDRYNAKHKKYRNKSILYKKQALQIGKLQEDILRKAKKQGYKVNVKPVQRHGVSIDTRRVNRALNFALPGIGIVLNRSLEKGKADSESVYHKLGANATISKAKRRRS